MGLLIQFPPRPFPKAAVERVTVEAHEAAIQRRLAKVEANRAQAQSFLDSPRGQLLTACSRLADMGYEFTADQVVFNFRCGFQIEDRPPNPKHLGLALEHLATIPDADPIAFRQARLGAAALMAIAFPFTDEPAPKGAA